MIRGNDKKDAQKTVDEILEGKFDARHVKYLFITLRDHSSTYKIFYEIAHFVAHSDNRNCGITNDALESFYLSFRYFSEYATENRKLDISKPFPAYIKKLMMYQVDKCEDADLKRRFNAGKDRIKSQIENLFKYDKKSNTFLLKHIDISQNKFEMLNHILGFIGTKPAYTSESILSELYLAITSNHLICDFQLLSAQKEKIILSVLCLIHNTKYDFGAHKYGQCKISCENPSIIREVLELGTIGIPLNPLEQYGNLSVLARVSFLNQGKEVNVCFTVLSTDLAADYWCEESMLKMERCTDTNRPIYFRKIDFDQEISINEKFRLEPLGC